MVKVINWFGYITLTAIVLITCVDVVGRYFFNKPLQGTTEITEISMGILAGFAAFYTSIIGGHINVDILTNKLSRRTQVILIRFGSFIGFVIWALISYRVFWYGIGTSRLPFGNTSDILHIPLAPVQYTLAAGLALYSLAELMHVFLPPDIGGGGGGAGL